MHICYRYDSKEGWGKSFIQAAHVFGKSIQDATCVDKNKGYFILGRSLTYCVAIKETAGGPKNSPKHLVVERN